MATYRPMSERQFAASLAAIREATARDRARLAQFELLAPDDEDAEMEVAHGRGLVPVLEI